MKLHILVFYSPILLFSMLKTIIKSRRHATETTMQLDLAPLMVILYKLIDYCMILKINSREWKSILYISKSDISFLAMTKLLDLWAERIKMK